MTHPDIQPHPTVAAPKCADCVHHTQVPVGHNPRAHVCAHPVVARDLVTGHPTQRCADMRNDGPAGYMPAPGAVAQRCGAEGRLFAALPSKEAAALPGEPDADKLGVLPLRSPVDADQVMQRFNAWCEKRAQSLGSQPTVEAVLPVHPSRLQTGGPDCADCAHSYLDDLEHRHCNHHSLPVEYPLTRSVRYASMERQLAPRGSRDRCGPSGAWFSQRQDTRDVVPLCADCKHSGQDLAAYPDGKMVCSHPSVERAPVSGIAMRCDHARGRSVHCGEVGRLFEPRVSEAVGGLGD